MFSEFLENYEQRKEEKRIQRILNTREYYDTFGNKLTSSEAQMKFLLRNFETDTIIRMLKNKEAYIIVDDYYIQVFFAHSLAPEDMCIVFNNFQCEGEDEDEQGVLIIDANAKLIESYVGETRFEFKGEDQTMLI